MTKKYRAGYGDGSGQEYIVGPSPEMPSVSEALLTLRWGCSCCKDTSPLNEQERAFRDKVVKALNMHDTLKRFVSDLGKGGSMLGYRMERRRVKLLKELKA